jgi:hypothetical protein
MTAPDFLNACYGWLVAAVKAWFRFRILQVLPSRGTVYQFRHRELQNRYGVTAREPAILRQRPGRLNRDIPTREPGRPASGLVAATARLLPVADRERYAEEFRSELWDLAQAGAGRLRQLGYAFRQLLRAIPMSLTLRSPRRRSAVP